MLPTTPGQRVFYTSVLHFDAVVHLATETAVGKRNMLRGRQTRSWFVREKILPVDLARETHKRVHTQAHADRYTHTLADANFR